MTASSGTAIETINDPWRPRSDAWLQRPPSAFAGQPDRPILIGACPRSGTTLLRGLLDNHPDLAVPGETDFVFYLLRYRAGFGDLRKEANRRRIAEWLFVNTKGRGGDRLRGSWSRERAVEWVVEAEPTLGSVIARCFELFAARNGARRWGDKRPDYAGYIRWMFELFPDAQFINLVRDPRGAVASQLPLGWGEPETALPSSVATWETAVRRVDDFSGRLAPDQLLDVRFEDMVRDPRGTLNAVLPWAGLAADEETVARMISSKRRGRFREGWHDRLNEEIDPAPIDAWRDRLEPAQIAFVEEVTRPWFERFGYQPLPDLDATPDPADLVRLRRERRRRRWKWRRRAAEDVVNRLRTRGRPVAARRVEGFGR